jgi:hypothetical protein
MKYTIFIISIIGVLPILYFTRLHFEYNVPENGFDVLLFRIWYHPLCLASAYQFTRWLKLPIRCSRGHNYPNFFEDRKVPIILDVPPLKITIGTFQEE